MTNTTTPELISVVLYEDEDTGIFYMARVGDMIVSAWDTAEEEARNSAALFLEDPYEYLKQMRATASLVDYNPSIRPAIQDAQQRLRDKCKQLMLEHSRIEKILADWEE